MMQLSEALKDLTNTWQQTRTLETSSPTPQHGLVESDGKQNMLKPMEAEKQNPTESKPPPILSEPNLASQPQDSDQLISIITQCFNCLNNYGKTEDQLPSIIKMFLLVLGKYPMKSIHSAFGKYLERNSTMPTPADIVNIIDPPLPVLSGAAYIGLRKKMADDVYLTPSDRAFLRAYEEQETAKVRGGSEELREANREIEFYKRAKQPLIGIGWQGDGFEGSGYE